MAPEQNPGPHLALAFQRIHETRMAGMPLLNPALAVEAVEFQAWGGCWLGILITPWFMNLMLLPQAPENWAALPPGTKRMLKFPAVNIEFIAGFDADVGEYQACSLFSPMFEFSGQEDARSVAREALRQLLVSGEPARDAAGAGPESPRFLSRRDFLRGVISTGER